MADEPGKPNPYIRTYAQDVAALSASDPQAAQLSAGLKAQVSNDDESGRSAVLARLRARSQKEPPHENVVLPSTLPTPSALAEPISTPYVPPTPAPTPAPVQQPKPVVPVPIAPEPKILEEHIVPKKGEPVIPQTPLSNLPPPPPTSLPVEPPQPIPLKPKIPEGPSPIHTYTSDFSDRIDTKGASTFSVLAAQADESKSPRTQTEVPKQNHTNAIIVAFGVVLLLIGGTGSYVAYQYVAQHSYVPITPLVPSLVFADDRQEVAGEGSALMQAVAQQAQNSLPGGQVRILYLTESTTTANRKTVTAPLPGGRLVGALQLSAPDILLRNIGPESTVGIVHAGNESRAFFILRVLSYERTFAGMLSWEGDMQHQLSALYPLYSEPAPQVAPVSTSTVLVNGKKTIVTKTLPQTPAVSTPPHFVDEVTANHDVRALKDSQGRTIFLYGYRDKETLIIARDESAFTELSNRLAATKQQ